MSTGISNSLLWAYSVARTLRATTFGSAGSKPLFWPQVRVLRKAGRTPSFPSILSSSPTAPSPTSLCLHCLITLLQTGNKTGNSKVPLYVSFSQLLSGQRKQTQPSSSHKAGPWLSSCAGRGWAEAGMLRGCVQGERWWQMKSKVTQCMDMASAYRFTS